MTDDAEQGRLHRAGEWLVRIALPLAILAVVLAVFFGEQLGVDHEVQLIAPTSVDPGGALPVRALVFQDVTSPFARLTAVPVDVRLRSPSREVVVEGRLAVSEAGGADGVIRVPDDARGVHRLQAIARGSDGQALASVEGPVTVGDEPQLAFVHGRLAGALQRLSLGEVVAVTDAPPPSVLDARVVGAACVPEAPCTLLVHVGEPAAAVRVARSASAEPRGDASEPTAGIARLSLVTHGPEAATEIEALRDGVVVARRPIQIPTALATPGLTLSTRVAEVGAPIELEVSVLGDRPGVIVDAYIDGRWRQTGSFARTGDAVPLPFALGPGVWTLEVRTDPFSAERSAVRRVAIGAPPADIETAPPGEPTDRMAWVSADHEVRVHRQPDPVRGLTQDLAKLSDRRGLLRTAALFAIGLGLIVLVAVVLRRGVDAALEAQGVMDATGDPELSSARHKRRTLLSALAIVATLLVAFLGAAALVIARARLLE